MTPETDEPPEERDTEAAHATTMAAIAELRRIGQQKAAAISRSYHDRPLPDVSFSRAQLTQAYQHAGIRVPAPATPQPANDRGQPPGNTAHA